MVRVRQMTLLRRPSLPLKCYALACGQDHLPLTLILRVLVYVVSTSRDLRTMCCVSTRLAVMASMDTLWVAAFVLRHWPSDFAWYPPLLQCLPIPVLFDAAMAATAGARPPSRRRLSSG